MTDETTVPDKVEAPGEEDRTLAERHRQFKVRATEVLHAYADDQGHCLTFDDVMYRVGLPIRAKNWRSFEYNDTPYLTLETVRGEETEEAFETWRRETARVLSDQIRTYELGPSARTAVREAGFPGHVLRTVNVEGTFRVQTTVKMMEGAPLIDSVTDRTARHAVFDNWYTPGAATWTVTVPEDPDAGPTPAA